MFKYLKSKINQLIEWISKGNEESFGSKRLDCCDLNKSKRT